MEDTRQGRCNSGYDSAVEMYCPKQSWLANARRSSETQTILLAISKYMCNIEDIRFRTKHVEAGVKFRTGKNLMPLSYHMNAVCHC
jgi:hypothetical protein